MTGELRCDFREHHFNKNSTRLDQQGLELDKKLKMLRQSWKEQSGELRALEKNLEEKRKKLAQLLKQLLDQGSEKNTHK